MEPGINRNAIVLNQFPCGIEVSLALYALNFGKKLCEKLPQAGIIRYGDKGLSVTFNQLNGIDPELSEVKAGGVVATKSVDATYHEMLRVIKLLEFPEEWIPPTRAKYVESVRAGGKPIVEKLKNYAAQIAKLR